MAIPAPLPPSESDLSGHRRIAIVVALALAAGFVWGVLRLSQLRFAPSEWAPSTWVDGQAGKQVNKALGTLPGQTWVDRASAALRFRFFGDLGPQVLEGCPGWLFYRDGLRPAPGSSGAFVQRAELMRHWAAQWKKTGIHLLVLTVPDKSRVQAAQLCGLRVAAPLTGRLDEWQHALAGGEVPFVDLRSALGAVPQAFYRTDVHMTQEGAEAAADISAKAALPILGGKGTQEFTSSSGAEAVPRMGDLIVLAGLEHAPKGWRPELEQVVPEHIEPVRSGGLLDEGTSAQVILLGDSNGLRSEFAERLGRQLGGEVWNLSQDGGYFSGAMLAALDRQRTLPHSLKLVVWQFSELSLSLPLTPAEQRALDAIR